MLAFVFPGQGSQHRRMGAALFDSVPEFARLEPSIDTLLGYSLRRLCLEDPDDHLEQTQYTQPAMYVVNALHYYKAVQEGERPQFLAGHSLGEFNALLAAGVFDLMTGLQLVKKRGELMAGARKGGMAAVIGLEPLHLAELVRGQALSKLDVANFNSPSQTLVSGPISHIKRAGPHFERAGARMYMPLDVGRAFHSRYMRSAADAFGVFMKRFMFATPQLPVISNVTAEPYATDGPTSVQTLLEKQITHSVRWVDTIRYLMRSGATRFKEIGPGSVLTRLGQQIQH